MKFLGGGLKFPFLLVGGRMAVAAELIWVSGSSSDGSAMGSADAPTFAPPTARLTVAMNADLPEKILTQPCLLVEYASAQGEVPTWSCQVDPVDYFNKPLRDFPIQGLDLSFLSSALSGQSYLSAIGAIIRQGIIDYSQATNISLLDQAIVAQSINAQGTHYVLAIRIKGSDTQYSTTEDDLYNNVFDDAVCLRSQYAACSYGALRMEPFVGKLGSLSISRGIFTVDLNTALTGVGYSQVQTLVLNAADVLFNSTFWQSQLDHIMMFMPKGVMVPLGVAQRPGTISSFRFDANQSNTVMMHEVGHNMNLQHSSEESEGEYGDQSCVMGFSYVDDDLPMCFNGAKSFELGWYSGAQSSITFDLASGSAGDATFDLLGVSDYGLRTNGQVVVVHVVVDGIKDYFVAYNRAAGINKLNQEGRDQILITQWEAGPGSYSWLRAKLNRTSSTCAVPNFAGSTDTLEFHVLNLNNTSTPRVATIRICKACSLLVNSPSVNPTTSPIAIPTSRPTGSPSSSPERFPTVRPSVRPTTLPSLTPSHRPVVTPSKRPIAHPARSPSSHNPHRTPSAYPTKSPSKTPLTSPSNPPSKSRSQKPTARPSEWPSRPPLPQPSGHPIWSHHPTVLSLKPSGKPERPVKKPAVAPSVRPSLKSREPSKTPSMKPSAKPSRSPGKMTHRPSALPSKTPSERPSIRPTMKVLPTASSEPTAHPTKLPSHRPSSEPARIPSKKPSRKPSHEPSHRPHAISSVPTTKSSKPTVTHHKLVPTLSPKLAPVRPESAAPIHGSTRSPFALSVAYDVGLTPTEIQLKALENVTDAYLRSYFAAQFSRDPNYLGVQTTISGVQGLRRDQVQVSYTISGTRGLGRGQVQVSYTTKLYFISFLKNSPTDSDLGLAIDLLLATNAATYLTELSRALPSTNPFARVDSISLVHILSPPQNAPTQAPIAQRTGPTANYLMMTMKKYLPRNNGHRRMMMMHGVNMGTDSRTRSGRMMMKNGGTNPSFYAPVGKMITSPRSAPSLPSLASLLPNLGQASTHSSSEYKGGTDQDRPNNSHDQAQNESSQKGNIFDRSTNTLSGRLSL